MIIKQVQTLNYINLNLLLTNLKKTFNFKNCNVMWNLIKNNNIKIIFYLLVIDIFVFIFNFNRGLELSYDSYMSLYSLYPEDSSGRISNFGLIGNFLIKISDNDIYFFRL